MGLDTTHGAFHGSYTGFNCFRKAIAAAVGGSYPPHDPSLKNDAGKPLDDNIWYFDTDKANEQTHPGLVIFFNHSDCDGHLTPEECRLIANEMEPLLPVIDEQDRDGWIGKAARNWIAGCREAAECGENLEFR